MSLRAIWNWIDADLNGNYPWSMLLILVPLVPLFVAVAIGVGEPTETTLLVGGVVVAAPWFFYCIWRGVLNIGRSFKETADFFANQRGGRSDG